MYLNVPKPNELEHPSRNSNQKGKDAAFGCSLTYGIGVEEGEDWPSLLNLYNYGRPGSSNDRAVRHAIEYILEHNPENIYVMWTFNERSEYIDSNGNTLKYNPSRQENFDKQWHKSLTLLSNSYYDNYNQSRNELLLRTFCRLHQVTLYELYYKDCPIINFSKGSDGAHPGADWHAHVAEKFKSKRF
jgi:hypothetical protein